MSVLAHKWVASGALNGQAEFARARVCVILHGIMGSGRNWMTAARQLVKRRPNYKCLLVDHRGHGANGTAIPGPHSLQACVADVAATVAFATGSQAPTPSEASALLPDGTAPMVLGHSFGGKVGLLYASSAAEPPRRTWLLDSNPSAATSSGSSHTAACLAAIKAESPRIYASTKELVAALEGRGLDAATAQWLAMTTVKEGAGARLAYDCDAVHQLYESYVATDLRDAAARLDAADRLGLVVAGAADHVPKPGAPGDLGLAHTHVLAGAGHNVHVDKLPELLELLLGPGDYAAAGFTYHADDYAADWT